MNRWDIYWADVPFEDNPQLSKIRPVIVCADRKVYVLAVKVTTHEKREINPYDYSLIFWRESGLPSESVVRIDKLSQLPPSAFGSFIGRVNPADAVEIQKRMTQYVQERKLKSNQ